MMGSDFMIHERPSKQTDIVVIFHRKNSCLSKDVGCWTGATANLCSEQHSGTSCDEEAAGWLVLLSSEPQYAVACTDDPLFRNQSTRKNEGSQCFADWYILREPRVGESRTFES